ncbi:MAG: hypothetical protein AB1779_06440, partial [Candidatus Thermoplasmatota archaeon]
DCTICKRCMEVCERNAIEVSGDDKKFILSFETDGSITTSDALRYALSFLEKKFSDFRDVVATIGEE